jgi:hypothetical protein
VTRRSWYDAGTHVETVDPCSLARVVPTGRPRTLGRFGSLTSAARPSGRRGKTSGTASRHAR